MRQLRRAVEWAVTKAAAEVPESGGLSRVRSAETRGEAATRPPRAGMAGGDGDAAAL